VKERRKHRRIKALFDQEGVALVRHETEILVASLDDLSAEGALLKFPNATPIIETGAVVSLWLDSGGTFVQVEAAIIRVEPGYLAVQFLDLNAIEREEIRTKMIRMEIIAARLEKQSPRHDGQRPGWRTAPANQCQ
jgi:hypothetical protein